MNEVTCILTSCGRFDLLRITLESFFKFNTYPVKQFYVNDDSGLSIPQSLRFAYPFIAWIENKNLKNQIESLDFLWSTVSTPYAFTMEDDWEFLREGFIEDSMEILEQDEKLLMVWLIKLEEMNQHPIMWKPLSWKHRSPSFGILKSSDGIWAGTRFNPALKRKADYDLVAPFSKHTEWNPNKAWKSEADISKVYHKLGFKGAILPQTYIKHIGEGRRVK